MGKLLDLFRGAPVQREPGRLLRVEIVGESFNEAAIRQVARRHGDREFPIVLRVEPGNEYDANAVEVLVDGRRVGHLSRTMAAKWRPMLDRQGGSTSGVARLCGGTSDKPNVGVFGSAEWFGPDA